MLWRRRSLYFDAKVGLRSDPMPVCGRAAEVGGCGYHDGVVGAFLDIRTQENDRNFLDLGEFFVIGQKRVTTTEQSDR